MSPVRATHLRHALRRAWKIPARSVLALVLCALAWLAAFDAASQVAALDAMLAGSAYRADRQVYRLAIAKAHFGARRHAAVMPREFVEQVLRNSPDSMLKLRGQLAIRTARENRTTAVDMVFYGRTLDEADARGAAFPACAVIGMRGALAQARGLVHVVPNWRCQPLPVPGRLRWFGSERSGPALVLPLRALGEVAGPRGLDKVDTLWVALADAGELQALLRQARSGYRLELTGRRIGDRVQDQAAQLMSISSLSGVLAAAGLVLGVGLYVQAVFGAMRRELSLRACFGTPAGPLAGWLATDVLAQSLLLATASGIAAMAAHLTLGGLATPAGMVATIGAVDLAIACLFSLACLLAVRFVAGHRSLAALARM